MNEQYDVIVIGGSIAGYCAAIKAADTGARVLLVDQETGQGESPFVDFVHHRDLEKLKLDSGDENTKEYFTCKGFVNVVEDKINLKFDYPEEFLTLFLRPGTLQSSLLEAVQNRELITIQKGSKVSRLLQEEGTYTGVELSGGEKFFSKMTVLAGSAAAPGELQIGSTEIWPAPFNRFKQIVRVTTEIGALPEHIRNRFQSRSLECYSKNSYNFFVIFPFEDRLVCDASLPEVSAEEAIEEVDRFLKTNGIANKILIDSNLDNLEYHTRVSTEFGIRLPVHYPGLLIAGESLNLASPLYIYSLYPFINTGIWAGEAAGKLALDNGANNSDEEYKKYEKTIQEKLSLFEDDFKIMGEATDGLDAFGRVSNNVLEKHDLYYPQIDITL
ncbi:MAG: FAD-dependent oxidoreductase [bacterium]|nr:FAD-dependent oxidoreductase [bacterium]